MNKFNQISNRQTFVGIDVAKSSPAVFVDSTNDHLECPNQTKDLRTLARRLKKLAPGLIVLEATGGYETLATETFSEFGLPFAVVFPKRVRQFALGLGIIAKTDDIDARTIAYYGRIADIQANPLPSDELRHLNVSTTRRTQTDRNADRRFRQPVNHLWSASARIFHFHPAPKEKFWESSICRLSEVFTKEVLEQI